MPTNKKTEPIGLGSPVCERCGSRCTVAPLPESQAKMLRRSKLPKGLCVNCAVHDWLRNTCPVNLLLAQSGPQSLSLPHIQQEFAGLMKSAGADALPDEINWQLIIDNWELPFPHKIKRSSMNPCDENKLERYKGKEILYRRSSLRAEDRADGTLE